MILSWILSDGVIFFPLPTFVCEKLWRIPCNPVVRIWCVHCWDLGLIPDRGTTSLKPCSVIRRIVSTICLLPILCNYHFIVLSLSPIHAFVHFFIIHLSVFWGDAFQSKLLVSVYFFLISLACISWTRVWYFLDLFSFNVKLVYNEIYKS